MNTPTPGESPPSSGPRQWYRATPGVIMQVIRRAAGPVTKLDIAQQTGLSRGAVTQRIDALLAAGLITGDEHASPETGGRPAEQFLVNPDYGVILIADMGATGMRTALVDTAGRILSERLEAIDIARGPDKILAVIRSRFKAMLASRHLPADTVVGIGLSVPGPVDARSSRIISPPIMTGWHEYDIPGFFRVDYSCSIVVEKDANAMVYGVFCYSANAPRSLVFVKIGTGIGTGLMMNGTLYRGADGAAGDIGHTRLNVAADEPPLCRCGNLGCVEAYAGGWAMLRDLQAAGVAARTIDDLVVLVRDGNQRARDVFQQATGIIGTAVAALVNTVNPRLVVVGGQLASLGDLILAALREKVYSLSLPLATRNLTISTCEFHNPGVLGLAALVADRVFAPATIDSVVAKH